MNNDIVPGFDDEKDDRLKIRLKRIDGVPCCLMLSLAGYLDTHNHLNFHTRVLKAIEAGFIRLIFNMAGLLYEEDGIGSFRAFVKAVQRQGGDLILVGCQPKIYEIFRLLGFSQFFIFKENIGEAVHYFKRNT
jgi:anti-sigma B factor antagonist